MKVFDSIENRARTDPRHIVLAEGEDRRVLEGAARAASAGIARITLLGREDEIRRQAAELEIDPDGIRIVDPGRSEHLSCYAATLHELRRHKGMTYEQARELAARPLYFADLMVRRGDADGSVAGAVHSTADTVRTAIQVIGTQEGIGLVSSFFLMMLCEPYHTRKGGMIFADCGLVVEPSAEELAEIAAASADSARALLGTDPRVAMLSFSTRGSADHPNVHKVARAAELVRSRLPDVEVDGDLQLDACLVPEIGARKAPGSEVAGRANVLIFPNLEAGNIGYKLAERIGNCHAIGPILQGLRKPANDLSRGCSADDVYRVIAVTVAQAQATTVRPPAEPA